MALDDYQTGALRRYHKGACTAFERGRALGDRGKPERKKPDPESLPYSDLDGMLVDDRRLCNKRKLDVD